MDRVKFKINGNEYSVGSEASSNTTLLDYIRHTIELRGTKYMCLEGGCGACIVSAVTSPGGTPHGVNACLVPITSCNDWEITTVEEIGNRLKGYHSIQKALAENHGSQCGYCSPGWVMAFYSILQNKKPTMLEIEKSFGSNICRCTGYRPILDAFKTFGSDFPVSDIQDIEDLRICNKTNESCLKEKCGDSDWCFVTKNEIFAEPMYIQLSDGRDWYKVHNLADVFAIWNEKSKKSYMLVAGNTGKGVHPILEYPQVLIDITCIKDLQGYYLDQNLVIGAGNTLTEVLNIFESQSNEEYFNYLSILRDHLELVAHIPVRNRATLAGNLMLKNAHSDFKSDIFLLLETVGAELNIMTSSSTKKTISMKNFLKEDMKEKIIVSIIFPPLSDEYKLVTYKLYCSFVFGYLSPRSETNCNCIVGTDVVIRQDVMPRSQNAHAIVHAGFLYKLSESNTVCASRLVYSGLNNSYTRASKTEHYLSGKKLFDNETLKGALTTLDKELVVTENLPSPPAEHRRTMALGLFYKGLLSLCPSNILGERFKSGAIKLRDTRPVSKAQQVFDTDPSKWPLNQPIQKVDALIQCAGEAKFTEDLPKLPDEVYAAFVLSTVPLGTIDKIDPSKALKVPGVVDFYSAKDIPGENTFTPPPVDHFVTTNEEIIAASEIKYYNQPIGIIVANDQYIANKAATLVEVTYKNVKKPIIDVRITKKDPNKTTLVFSQDAKSKGNDVVKVVKEDYTIFGQYHFCMETLVTVTQPSEEGIKVHAAAQWMDAVQQSLSRMLKISQNRLTVVVRRLGGAFGLKISRISQVATACALVSYKLNKPCRFIQTLTNNMRAVGKRLPCSVDFEAGVNSQGAIQYINHNIYSDNGCIVNEPLIMLGVGLFNNCYKKDLFNYKVYNVVTDTPSNSWCRAPGTLENIAMTEIVMERISCELNLDPLQVRLANLDTKNYGDMNELLQTLKTNSNYEVRKDAVEAFNNQNMWKKRGLRFTFLSWPPAGNQYFNVILTVYNDDGSITISHGGVEMGQGINTRAIQTCAYLLNIPVEKVRVAPSDTTKTANGFPAGGSITSQNVVVGVKKCCEELLKRLEPIKQQMNNPTWKQLIKKAYEMETNLQVQTIINVNDNVDYIVFGITLLEVEIDVLTGEWQIIRVDLIEDCGQSVNPKLDLGQIEGAFIMGASYFTTEQLVTDPKSGELLTNRTWDYWVMQALDIPQDFRIYLRKRSYSSPIILGSKATGEPATCMGIVISFALRHAIAAARKDSGIAPTEWLQIDGPFTVDTICYACSSLLQNFKFY